MTKEERDDIHSFIEWEGGLEAAFVSYGFSDHKDEHLRELISKFVEAHRNLEQYIYHD